MIEVNDGVHTSPRRCPVIKFPCPVRTRYGSTYVYIYKRTRDGAKIQFIINRNIAHGSECVDDETRGGGGGAEGRTGHAILSTHAYRMRDDGGRVEQSHIILYR